MLQLINFLIFVFLFFVAFLKGHKVRYNSNTNKCPLHKSADINTSIDFF